MNQPEATEGCRVAQEIAAIRAALKKCGYCIHKRPKQAVWKVFNSEHGYLLTYQPAPISAWVLHPQNNDTDYQTKDATASRCAIATIIQRAIKKQPANSLRRAS